MVYSAPFVYSEEVEDAIHTGKPVVALESTIISHGFPYPENIALGRALEQEVRDHGAVPATIAIQGGIPRIGLDDAGLERLGNASEVVKCSARDLPVICAGKKDGATTVAATCKLAELAGVHVFATGGIGGVHRGAEVDMDVSADLRQMAASAVAVVSAGAKAILDIGLTLEVLESLGLMVVGYRTDDFPAFYTRTSGFQVPHRVDSIEELAQVILWQKRLEIPGGSLICNPIPEAFALPKEEVDAWIVEAIAEAKKRGVAGKDLTPFLLGYLLEISEGRTLVANRALALHNARTAAKLACAISSNS